MPVIEEILRQAMDAGASDVHLTAGLPPQMRVNGQLSAMDYPRLKSADTLEVLLRVMNEVQRERFDEQGECDASFSVPRCGRCRVNAYRQRGSTALAFRLVGTRVPTLKELGIPQSIISLTNQTRGLVLVNGGTGSGKTTTLAAMIDQINNSRAVHIITLEDPIEYLHQHRMAMINQREIGIDSQSYASALRSALREDPDVILVGDLRDYETVSVAITAAETGHLVLSTLHTGSAPGAVDRIIDLFPRHQQQQAQIRFANVLEAVVSQQLIPLADGSGRVAAFEVMLADAEVRQLIREGSSGQLTAVMEAGREQGMITMDDAIVSLCSERLIDREMAVSFVQEPERVAAKLKQLG